MTSTATAAAKQHTLGVARHADLQRFERGPVLVHQRRRLDHADRLGCGDQYRIVEPDLHSDSDCPAPTFLTVATSDNGNTGGGALADVDTVDITINAVADVVTDNLTTNEDAPITANVLTGTNGASADDFENAGRAISGVTQGTP